MMFSSRYDLNKKKIMLFFSICQFSFLKPMKVAHIEPQSPIGQPAKIIRGLKNEQAKEGDTLVLKALFTGYPMPTVK